MALGIIALLYPAKTTVPIPPKKMGQARLKLELSPLCLSAPLSGPTVNIQYDTKIRKPLEKKYKCITKTKQNKKRHQFWV